MKLRIRSLGAIILFSGWTVFPVLATQSPFVEGKAYVQVVPGVRAGKGEVIEFFSYGCIYCFRFAPLAKKLAGSLPGGFKFRLIPSVMRPDWEPYARAFYAAKDLGVLQQSQLYAFNFVMNERKGRASLEQMADFYARYGVSRKRFLNVARSNQVSERIDQDSRLAKAWKVDGTPTVVVNGEYMTEDVDSVQELAELVSWLLQHKVK